MVKPLLFPLATTDAAALLRFETENRQWFEDQVGPRPDAYWNLDSLRGIIQEQQADDDLMYLIRPAPTGDIWGRLNVTLTDRNVGQLGYRVAQHTTGQGIATQAVAQVLPLARDAGLWALEAQVADSNPASKQVLVRNGFSSDQTQTSEIETHTGEVITLTVFRLQLD